MLAYLPAALAKEEYCIVQSLSRRMLISLAHPDDESFGMAGTIARYAAEGVDISLICTTNGDVGTVAADMLKGYDSVADLRLAELDCAAKTLKLSRIITFGYRDSGMAGSPDNQHPASLAAADVNTVAARITRVIREIRPQVVVTFDPYGGYGHPDHIATHHATVNAFHAAGNASLVSDKSSENLKPYSPQKLYFTTFDRALFRLIVRLMPLVGIDPTKMGRNKDMDGRAIVRHSYPIHARIATGAYSEIANRARRCHASQLGGFGPRRMSQIIGALIFGTQDHFMRAYPSMTGSRIEKDLFEGVKPD